MFTFEDSELREFVTLLVTNGHAKNDFALELAKSDPFGFMEVARKMAAPKTLTEQRAEDGHQILDTYILNCIENTSHIEAIKSIRTKYFQLGLKEAKDIADNLRQVLIDLRVMGDGGYAYTLINSYHCESPTRTVFTKLANLAPLHFKK